MQRLAGLRAVEQYIPLAVLDTNTAVGIPRLLPPVAINNLDCPIGVAPLLEGRRVHLLLPIGKLNHALPRRPNLEGTGEKKREKEKEKRKGKKKKKGKKGRREGRKKGGKENGFRWLAKSPGISS